MKSRKSISIILAVLMLISFLPNQVLANNDPAENVATEVSSSSAEDSQENSTQVVNTEAKQEEVDQEEVNKDERAEAQTDSDKKEELETEEAVLGVQYFGNFASPRQISQADPQVQAEKTPIVGKISTITNLTANKSFTATLSLSNINEDDVTVSWSVNPGGGITILNGSKMVQDFQVNSNPQAGIYEISAYVSPVNANSSFQATRIPVSVEVKATSVQPEPSRPSTTCHSCSGRPYYHRYSDSSVYVGTPSVYYDRVNGYTEAGSRVDLYRNGVFQGSAKADSNGYYNIYHNFGYYNTKYYGGRDWYDGRYLLSPSSKGSYSSSGYTTANTYVVAFDQHGNFLADGYSDSSGYYSLSYSYVSNPSGIRVYKAYYKDGYYGGYYYRNGYYYKDGYYYSYPYYSYYYDISSYELRITAPDGDYRSYSLSNANVQDYYYRTKYSPTRYYYYDRPYRSYSYRTSKDSANTVNVYDISPGQSKIVGYNANSYAEIVARDSSKNRIGSATADSDGRFTIETNRNLRSGEYIDLIVSKSGYEDKITTVRVKEEEKFNYRNIVTIGSTTLEVSENGVKSTKIMDVAPYIKDGRTMLPIRFVAESLGFKVTFFEHSNEVMIRNGDLALTFNIYGDSYKLNGREHKFEVAPEIRNDRTMLPISEVAKALNLSHGNIGEGKNIEWDANRQQVIIQISK